MKKAILFTPYADIFSGGEQYFFSVAQTLVGLGFHVTIAWPKDLRSKLEKYFNLDLQKVVFSSPAYHELIRSRKHRKQIMVDYDLSFWVSDGSIPTLYAKTNYLHYQVPFTNRQIGLKARLKARSIHRVICNSKFTQKVVNSHTPFSAKTIVLHPYINLSELPSIIAKEKIILSVGTIGGALHNKRQDILINTFAKFHHIFPDWELVLIGRVESQKELVKLQKMSTGLPVKILSGVSRNTLLKYYAKSSFYWHATGFGLDPTKHPEKMEHFGISIIEALASGCIPVCYQGGEITNLLEAENLYSSESELLEKTLVLIDTLNPQAFKTSRQLAKRFDHQYFADKFKSLLSQDKLITSP